MPRQARKKSENGIYHVMLRGINQQQIFEDKEDNLKFLEVLNDYKAISGYEIFAYCLMGNHVHLLIKVGKEDLCQIFKRIGGRFVYWYNLKYKRSGHLFQDRFKSEPIDDDSYFLTVIRYIHNNPVKAGLSKTANEYQYSSYNEYTNTDLNQTVNTKFALNIIDIKQFVKFHIEENEDKCLEIEVNFRLTDKEAWEIIKKTSKCKSPDQFQNLDVISRDKNLKKLKEKGLSIRQLSRLTGISKGIIEKQ